MTTLPETIAQDYPNGWVEEVLCEELAEQEAPQLELMRTEHRTSISGARVDWTMIRPSDSNLVVDDRPILIENGLCGSDEAYFSLAEALGNRGYKVLVKTPPRHQNPTVAYQPHNLLHPMELQSKAGWAVMRDYMRQFPAVGDYAPQQFHIVGHSMGGPVSADLAQHHKEHVASLTLVASAGLERHHTPKMAYRLGKVALKELAPAVVLPGRIANGKLALASLKHVTSVVNRTAREALEVSNTYAIPVLKELKSADIPLHAIQPVNDHFFPFQKQLGAIHLFERFIKFNVGRADHLAPQTQSELMAAVISDVLAEPDYSQLIA